MLDNTELLFYSCTCGVAEMSKKKTLTETASANLGFSATLEDIVNSIEDELVVIDNDYHIRFANKAMQARFQNRGEQPVGQLCYQALYNRQQPCRAPLWDCPLKDVLMSGKITDWADFNTNPTATSA